MTSPGPSTARPAGRDVGSPDDRSPDSRRQSGTGALSPVRAALIGDAVARAGGLRIAAVTDADTLVARARRQAGDILSRARADGESDGRAAAEARRAEARRAARSVVLEAQLAACDRLRREARATVGALRDDPMYPRLLVRLEELARNAAGPSAVVTRHPSGGIVAEGKGTYVDCSLSGLAGQALEALGAEVSTLWTG